MRKSVLIGMVSAAGFLGAAYGAIGEINVKASAGANPPTVTDSSALWLKTGTRIVVMITDPQGRSTGVEAGTFATKQDIPGSECDVDFIANPYTKEEHAEAYERISITPAPKGAYKLQLHGLQTGPYEIAASSLWRNGSSQPSKDIEGIIGEGEDKLLILTFDPTPHSALSVIDPSAHK